MPYYVLVRKKFILKELYLKAVISENNVFNAIVLSLATNAAVSRLN